MQIDDNAKEASVRLVYFDGDLMHAIDDPLYFDINPSTPWSRCDDRRNDMPSRQLGHCVGRTRPTATRKQVPRSTCRQLVANRLATAGRSSAAYALSTGEPVILDRAAVRLARREAPAAPQADTRMIDSWTEYIVPDLDGTRR